MLWWVRWRTPCIVFLSACAFARNPVWISTAQAGIFNWLVSVNANFMFSCKFYVIKVFVNHKLAVMPFVASNTVFVYTFYISAIGYITCFYLAYVWFFVKGKSIFHLVTVVAYIAWCFMVANELYAFFFAVLSKRCYIKVVVRFGKVKYIAIKIPIAIPANIPAFNEYAIKTILRCKIHIVFCGLRSGAVFFTATPSLRVYMHTPPNTDVFTRFNPRHVTEFIRLV